jgi:hypothetical protein
MPVTLPEEHHNAWLTGEAGKRFWNRSRLPNESVAKLSVLIGVARFAGASHPQVMNEDEIENHFDEMRDELRAYKKQLDSLGEDLKLLIKHSTAAHHDIIATANPVDDTDSDRFEVHRCREFLEKYDIRH